MGPFENRCSRDRGRVARADQGPPRPGLQFKEYPTEATASRPSGRDLSKRPSSPAWGNEAMGSGAHEFVEQCPQEARMVYRARGTGHRLLDRLLRGSHHRRQAHSASLEPVSMGGPASPQALRSRLLARPLILQNRTLAPRARRPRRTPEPRAVANPRPACRLSTGWSTALEADQAAA